MKVSRSLYHDKHYGKRERCLNMGKLVPFMLPSLFIATIFSLFLLYSPNPWTLISKHDLDSLLQQRRMEKDFPDSVRKQQPEPMQDRDSVQKQPPEPMQGRDSVQKQPPETMQGRDSVQKQPPETMQDGDSVQKQPPEPFQDRDSVKKRPPDNMQDHDSVQKQDRMKGDNSIQDEEQPNHLQSQNNRRDCDFFKGRWVRELRGNFYTNTSCTTIPETKNCFKNGREDMDFLNWRWKPDECELPRFDARSFLRIVRGKKMAFIGDSVSRNHMESLLCLLSQEETPEDVYKDADDRFRTWYFPRHNFTLMVLWSKFLVEGEERMINGTGTSAFDLQIDKVEDKWAKHLPELDYAIISGGHWFFRVLYLHEGENMTGCVYCHEPNVTDVNIDFALRMALRTTFNYVNDCKNCSTRLVTLLRTFAPAHFENGAWNTGGYCNRTSPSGRTEKDLEKFDWQIRNVQVEELERVIEAGQKQERKLGFVDVTRAMLMRPDGHPGEHWGNKWKAGYNDCIHWCIPGPVDTWNELFLAVLTREAGLVLD